MSIDKLHISNFKRFENENFDLSSPITLLVGPNNSGKSSLIKALLGFKQTVSGANEHEVFAGQGDYVDLGTFNDFVYNHNSDKKIGLGITITESKNYNPFSRGLINILGKPESIEVYITFDIDPTTEQAKIYKIDAKIRSKEKFSFNLERKQTRSSYWLQVSSNLIEHLAKQIGFNNSEVWSSEKPNLEEEILNWKRGRSIDHQGKLTFSLTRNNFSILDSFVSQLFDDCLDIFSKEFDQHQFYLGPLRHSPARSYIRSAHSLDVGPTGLHTPSVFSILDKRAQHSTTGSRKLHEDLKILNQWIAKIFPGRSVKSQSFNELVKLYVLNDSGRQETVPDIGFGFSQIFPVLVQATVMQPASLLIVEQPELHLHPLAQTQLADVFSQAVKEDKKYLIETHSEHLIRGLQVAISRHRIDSSTGLPHDAIKILYIPEQPYTPFEIGFNEAGELNCKWPSGFFDEGYKQTLELLRNKSYKALD